MIAFNRRYESDFARRYFDEGEARGKAHALLLILNARGVLIADEQRSRITSCSDLGQLNVWILRASSAVRARDLGASFSGGPTL